MPYLTLPHPFTILSSYTTHTWCWHTHTHTQEHSNPDKSPSVPSHLFLSIRSLHQLTKEIRFNPVYSHHRISLQTQMKVEPPSKTSDLQNWVLWASAPNQGITYRIPCLPYRQTWEVQCMCLMNTAAIVGTYALLCDCWICVDEQMGQWWIRARKETGESCDERKTGVDTEKIRFGTKFWFYLTSIRIRVYLNQWVVMRIRRSNV